VLADRQELDLPPFTRVAEVTGDKEACHSFLETTQLPDATEVLGPGDLVGPEPDVRARAGLRIEPRRSRGLADALRAGVAARSARMAGGSLRVRLDRPDDFCLRQALTVHGRWGARGRPVTPRALLVRRLGLAAGVLLAVTVYLLMPGEVPHPAKLTAATAVLMAVWWMTEALPSPATALVPLVLFPVLSPEVGFDDVGAS